MKSPRLFRHMALALALLAGRAGAAETAPLTLASARELALKMHPGITAAELRALAAKQVVVETQAGFYPLVSANATAVGTGETVTRLAAGSLSNSQIYDHVGVGATVSQLITDFGRSSNLSGAAKLRARAADDNVAVIRAQLLLAVDAAYFDALEARTVKAVAAKTLANRQLLFDQVGALARNQLKSELDVRFAQVGVGEAKLLADKADGDWQSALARLANLIGQRTVLTVELMDAPMPPDDLPADAETLTDMALRQRPDLLQQRAERDATQELARAARDARLPTISAVGAAGVVPVRNVHFEHDYAAAGVNVNVPVFAGGLYRARQREADLQAGSADAMLQEAENNVIRDVRVAWLDASHARERIVLTQNLLENAGAALELAQARFGQGLSSIVELNQAELSQISAEIAQTGAEYDYRMKREILNYQTGSLH